MLLSPTQEDSHKSAQQGQQRKPRKPRGRGLRTTTGCAVCRRRHMKCDEAKPVCGPCAKGNRDCVYGHAKGFMTGGDQAFLESGGLPSGDIDRFVQSPSSAAGSTTSDVEPTQRTQSGRLPQSSTWQQPLPLRSTVPSNNIQYPHSTLDTHLQSIPALSTLPSQQWASTEQRHSPGSEPDLGQLPWNQAPYGDSQGSTPVSNIIEPFRWLGMLAEDCPFDDNDYFAARRAELMRLHSANNSPTATASLPDTGTGYPTPQMSHLNSPHHGLTPSMTPSSASRTSIPSSDNGHELWQAPISLTNHQICLFSTFVNHLSLWLDLFDPLKHFSTLVPQLALSNEGLMKAILALSARHLSIKPQEGNVRPDRTEAVQYYSETLQYLQRAMKHESYTRSPDIIATALIVSAYEMIDGAGKSWERHLKGVFWIQRSQENDGESGGIRQAVWWAWLRQDIWAAFRERRKCFSFWKPKKPYCQMNQYEIANRVVYLAAQAVNYASDEERKAGETNVQHRMDKADALLNMLDDWKRHLTVHFQELPIPQNSKSDTAFQIHWINPSPFACAMQYYHFARILLMIHRPAPGGYLEYSNRNSTIAESIDVIGGIAMTIKDPAATILSTQALYCAALYSSDPCKQGTLSKMIDEHQERTGWPVIVLSEELRTEWGCQAPFMFPTPPDESDILPDRYFDMAMASSAPMAESTMAMS